MSVRQSLLVYTLSHFVVDFACFFFLFSAFSEATSSSLSLLTTGFLAYNVVAFGLQPLIGYWFDVRRRRNPALTGCLLLTAGLLLAALPWASLFLCSIGNAFFHVGGGVDSLLHSNGKIARSGVFVSSGALGVILGTLAAQGRIPLLPVLLAVLACAGFLYRCASPAPISTSPTFTDPSHSPGNRLPLSLLLILCLSAILVRSYIGSVVPISWKNDLYVLLPPACAFLGKFSGGFLADRFGAKWVGCLSLLLSCPLLCFFSHNILLCSLGLFLFNLPMSITLWGIYWRFPCYPSLSFGLTTLALLCGVLPTFFYQLPEAAYPFLALFLILFSAACIALVIPNQKRKGGVSPCCKK